MDNKIDRPSSVSLDAGDGVDGVLAGEFLLTDIVAAAFRPQNKKSMKLFPDTYIVDVSSSSISNLIFPWDRFVLWGVLSTKPCISTQCSAP